MIIDKSLNNTWILIRVFCYTCIFNIMTSATYVRIEVNIG